MAVDVLKFLLDNNIFFIKHIHPPVYTVAESNEIIGDTKYLHTKSLFLKDNSSNFYLITLVAKKRLPMKFLEKHLSVKKLRFASSEELKKELDLTPGSVSPFGILNSRNVYFILDKEVLNSPCAGFHPNNNASTLELSKENIKRFFDLLKCNKEVLEIPNE
jgi:Ala-tRNA(Pro) deacylase